MKREFSRSGPSEYEKRRRRQAYERKMNAQARREITNEQIRTYLQELHKCNEADKRTCRDTSRYCFPERHAQDVLYSEDEFDAARTLVDAGHGDDVYKVLATKRIVKQLVSLCLDAGLVAEVKGMITGLTDDGRRVMRGDDFERPELSWDESKAQEWQK